MRRADWVERLWAEVDLAGTRRFEWGRHDCCLFAARVVDAILTDGGYVAELASRYRDQRSALRFLAEEGGLRLALTARFGEPVSWWRAQRGDLCLVDTEDGVGSVGVNMGTSVAFVRTDFGVEFMPLDSVAACWRVP